MVSKRNVFCIGFGLFGLVLLFIIGKFVYIYWYLNPSVKVGPTVSRSWKEEDGLTENLMWMIQISDIHLSAFRDKSRLNHFSEFCNTTIGTIKPQVVLATGDITDGTAENGFVTYQIKEEWKFYRDVLNKNRVPEKVIWLDIRGNHDNFNVPNVNSDQNYFRKYGVQGTEHLKHYSHEYKMRNEQRVTFIAVDACLEVGIRRPFNFIGSLHDHDIETIDRYSQTAIDRNSSYVIWFGHYPLSTILSPGKERFQEIIRSNKKSVVYVSGHLHTLGGLIPRMYAYQHGFFELELGDWKFDRTFRIMALDNGQFSFVDVVHNDWPYVLVASPKTSLLASEDDKPVNVNNVYKNIRMLVFSVSKIEKVSVEIDNSGIWFSCSNVDGPLYMVSWDPSSYSTGLHKMKIHIKDETGKSKIRSHEFSLDGSRMKFSLLGRMLLMCNIYSVFQCAFLFMVAISILPFITMRVVNILVHKNVIKWNFRLERSYCGLKRYWIMSNVNILFYPLVLYPIYLLIGPWYVMDLVEGKLGFIFSWGIWVDGSYIPESPAHFLGLFHLLAFHVPAVLLLASMVNRRLKILISGNLQPTKKFMVLTLCSDLLFLVLCAFMVFELYVLSRMEGLLSVLLCPIQTWWILLIIWLRHVIKTLPNETILKATKHWKKPGTGSPTSELSATRISDRKLTPVDKSS